MEPPSCATQLRGPKGDQSAVPRTGKVRSGEIVRKFPVHHALYTVPHALYTAIISMAAASEDFVVAHGNNVCGALIMSI